MKKTIAFAVLGALLCAACGGRSAVPASSVLPLNAAQPSSGTAVVALNDASSNLVTTTTVGVRLDVQHYIDPEYGFVLGYFKGKKATTSQVIGVSMGNKIRFVNVDGNDPHTASFLGKATAERAPWPLHFNGSMTRSPAGTAIGTKNFSTGTLNPGQASLVYRTGLPGFYMIGCAFHYVSNMMRTVIVVH